MPILGGVFHGLADKRLRRKVQHTVHRGAVVGGEHVVDDVLNLAFDKRGSFRNGVAVAGRQIVHDDHLVSRLKQGGSAHAAHIAGAAGDNKLHGSPFRAGESLSLVSPEAPRAGRARHLR